MHPDSTWPPLLATSSHGARLTPVGMTGHQDLPDVVVEPVLEGIRIHLAELDAGPVVGICSLAAGADQLFAHEVVSRGGELHVVVPSRDYESTFSKTTLERHRKLLVRAKTIERLEFESPTEAAFYAAGRRVVDLSEVVLAIWDGEPSRGLGGTADVVACAESRSKPIIIIWPQGASR